MESGTCSSHYLVRYHSLVYGSGQKYKTFAKRTIQMKTGDVVRYGYSKYEDESEVIGVVLLVNEPGGTLKVVDKFGKVDWFVASYCEVISESR